MKRIRRGPPRLVRAGKHGGGCAVFMAFVSGLLAVGSGLVGEMVGVVLFLGLAVLCMLSAILQRMR